MSERSNRSAMMRKAVKSLLLVTILFFMGNVVGCNLKGKAVKENPSKGTDTAQGTSKETPPVGQKGTEDPSKGNTGDPTKGGTTAPSEGGIIQRPGDDDTAPRPDTMNKTVYYNRSSELYHYDEKCLALNKDEKVYSGKLGDVIKAGHKLPCRLCVPQ